MRRVGMGKAVVADKEATIATQKRQIADLEQDVKILTEKNKKLSTGKETAKE